VTRRLFLAPFGTPDATDRLLAAVLNSGIAPEKVLYLTPSPRKLRDTEWRFARLMGKRAFLPPLFRTLRQLSRELHRCYGTTRPFPAELKPLLVYRLLPLEPVKPTLGYARAVADFITDIKNHVAAEERPQLAQRLTELLTGFDKPLQNARVALNTLERFDAELAARGWSDDEDILAQAPGYLQQWQPPPELLVLDSFVAPNRLEQALLRQLITLCPATVALSYGAAQSDADYRLAEQFTQFLLSCAHWTVEMLPEPDQQPAAAARLFAFPDNEAEVQGICRAIREQGARLDRSDTIVVFPRLANYTALVERTFRQYSIPCTIYPSATLDTSGPVLAVLELLRALDSDYERIALAAALGTPHLSRLLALNDQEDTSTIAPYAQAVNHYSRRAGIIKDARNWRNIGQRVQTASDRELDEAELTFLRELQNRIRLALGRIGRLAQNGASLGKKALALKELLGQVRFCPEVELKEEPAQPGPALSKMLELLLDRKALYDLLDRLSQFERDFGPDQRSGDDLGRTLQFLTRLTPCSREPDPAGVLVIDMAETLGLTPGQLYFGGLTDSDLPGTYTPDPILPDRVRKALNMPDMEWHRDWQRFHFRRTLTAARSVPFLSFPESRQGNPVLVTPFLEMTPTRYHDSGAIYSRTEEQLRAGERQGERFSHSVRTVDFTIDQPVRAALAARFGPERALSVTRLEGFRRCPFRFYLENVLGLATPPEPTYEIDARQWGSLVHQVLGRLYAQGPVPIRSLRKKAWECLKQTLAEADLSPFWAEVTSRVFRNLLTSFIETEQQLRAEGFAPFKTELALSGNITPDIKVKGRLDRLDSADGALRIIDYKTGATTGFSARAVIEDRTHIQLPLYARLLEEEFPKRTVANLGIYSLRDSRIRWLADDDQPVAALITAALENTIAIVARIRAGKFPAEPASGAVCRHCDLAFTCGFQPVPAAQ